MKKLFAFTTIASIALTSTAFAKTFEVSLDVQNTSKELVIEEVSPITFPVINVDHSTVPGERCYTNYSSAVTYNELCRGTSAESGDRKSGLYKVLGNPFTAINLALAEGEAKNGLRLIPSFNGQSPTTAYQSLDASIDASGIVTTSVRGYLILTDPAAVTTETTVMTFDITASYQ